MTTKNIDKPAMAQMLGFEGRHLTEWVERSAVKRAAPPPSVPRFDLEGPIVGSSMAMYVDTIEGATTPAMLREFLKENEDAAMIEININSPGGSVFDANSMVSDLSRFEGDVNIVVSGACFSAAMDFLAVPGAHRIAMPGSLFMIHNAWTYALGNSKELQKVVDRLAKMNESCIDRFEKCSGYTRDELAQMMDDETWFSDSEAMHGGFIDELYEEESAPVEETEAAEDQAADVESMDDEDSERAIERANKAAAVRVAVVL